ncbi:hypothetical protein FACS1894123_03110 [Bacteroidia bacterium]|nr:hypothetical protein FACS1894123_03110 [Bacteroidia bacterium]
MKKTNAQPLGKALDDFFEQNPALSAKLFETRLMDSWSEVLGNSVSRFTKSLFIKNRVLYVKLTSSVLKNELTLCREQLIDKLNSHSAHKVIDNIVFT